MAMTPGYQALQEGAGLLERPGRGLVRVSGADRATWLQGLLTNDVAALAPDAGCYAAYLTPQGRLVTDMVVLALQEAIVLDVPPGIGPDLAARLDQMIFAEDVALADESPAWGRVGVHGPDAAPLVRRVLGGADGGVDAWPEHAHAPLAEVEGHLVRTNVCGVPGLELLVPAGDVAGWRARLLDAGAVPVTAEDGAAARIEAGRPEFPVDLDDRTIPLEAGLERRAISFTKGCYVGQEVIVRVLHRGQGRVARRLVRLDVQGSAALPAATPVARDGRHLGLVTSSAISPRTGHTVALAYVHRDAAEPGTAVEVVCADGISLPATVIALAG
jgi:folate-binding protein YgfZ